MIIIILVVILIYIICIKPIDEKYINEYKKINVLINKIKTEKNKNHIEQLIKYHNKRVNAGAVKEESLNRLVNDLKVLGNID